MTMPASFKIAGTNESGECFFESRTDGGFIAFLGQHPDGWGADIFQSDKDAEDGKIYLSRFAPDLPQLLKLLEEAGMAISR